MTRSRSASLLIALVLTAVPLSSQAASQTRENAAPAVSSDPLAKPGEFVVAASPEAAEAAGLNVVAAVGFGWTLITHPTDDPASETAAGISELTGFDVEPNYLYRLADEPLFADQWSLENTGQTGGTADADIDILEAWEWSTGADVVIGVLDTGVSFAHSDLSPNLWVNTDEIAANGIDDDGNGFTDDVGGWDALGNDADPSDTDGHGTFVATNAAAAINTTGMAGVAPDATVMPIRVCQTTGCSLSAIIIGLAYAVDNGADVLNLSFGGYSSSFGMESAIQGAVNAGITVIAAAGNDGNDNDGVWKFYPAGYDIDGLIAVASSDHNDLLSGFSNYGAVSVDLAAPGENVVGGAPPNAFATGSGTSFSAPQVTGVAALIRSLRPGATPSEVAELIMESVDPRSSLAGKVATGGRLNAGAAMERTTAPVAVAKTSPSNGILPFTAQLSGLESYDPVGEIVSWSWQLPDGSVASGAQTTWTPNKPGSYQATLTVTDSDGLTDTATTTFTAGLRPGGTFVDDNEHFAEGAIEAIAAEGITQGCNPPLNDRFCPGDFVTRGQMAAFLARALGIGQATADFFDDDEGSLFENAINKVAGAAITQGCNPPANNRYCPDDLVTRGQMAAFLARAFGLVDGAGADVFTDDDDSIFEAAIDKIAIVRITTGCNPPVSDRYCPDSPVTRGEMAVFLARALDLTPFYPPPA